MAFPHTLGSSRVRYAGSLTIVQMDSAPRSSADRPFVRGVLADRRQLDGEQISGECEEQAGIQDSWENAVAESSRTLHEIWRRGDSG